MTDKFVVWFNEVGKEDVGLVGGKGANLGEMTQVGIPVPPGFIVTANAYKFFLEKNGLPTKIRKELSTAKVSDPVSLQKASENIKKLIIHAPVPEEISQLIVKAYGDLKKFRGLRGLVEKDPLVAVRSSATAEDLPSASFAGQQATLLNIRGEASVVSAVREAWASLFEARAIFYREENKFDHFKVLIAVPVQKMVQSEVSGVMFTVDPVTNNKKTITIEAIWGLGELIVQGAVTPDHYEVNKDHLKISAERIVEQKVMLARKGYAGAKEVKVPSKLVLRRKLTPAEVVKIAVLGKKLEKHYYHPQDIEFAVEDREIFIVQTRPITTLSIKKSTTESNAEGKQVEKELKEKEVLLIGSPASPGIRSGPVKILASAKEIGKVVPGDILVATQTNPDYVPAMKKAVAIITDQGGRTSHAAIVSRELGIPAVVGTKEATKKLKNDDVVTVNGSSGKVFKGGLELTTKTVVMPPAEDRHLVDANGQPLKTATHVYVNLAEPEKAKEVAALNVDGVGLLRAEFMLAQIGTHPKEIIKERKQKVFTETLAENLKEFAQAFYPRPVVYRATDFKTNEYKDLKGGEKYEPKEPNPMLGFRGASRYVVQPDVFKMEMDAIKIVRNKYDLKNLWLMIPFVRTVEELIEVKNLLHINGLQRSPTFHLWMMVEVPATVILLEKFIEAGIDGVSIGNNDLTMMLLGTDRDNENVANIYNEKNEAVMWAYQRVIETCRKNKITSSMCGQAPSVYPELVEKLVNWGITSVSVSPDAVDNIRATIYEAEKKR